MLPPTMQRLALQAGGAGIELVDGRRVVTYADPVLIVRPEWLAARGVDVVQDDGSLVLDSDGLVRYAHRADFGDGTHLYQRV